MATFEARVEGLTGLAIESANSNPTQAQLSEFLKDGVADVVDRWTTLKPQDGYLFVRASSSSDTQAALSSNTGKIISVLRESGTADDWRECIKVPIGMQSRVTDSSSLFYASAFHPAYIISEDGAVLVYPAPSANNGYKIYYINSQPTNTSDATLEYSHSDIKYFPEEKVRLVVMYAGIKALQSAMGGMHSDADINAAFSNFKTNMTTGISQLTLSKEALDRIDNNLYNTFNFDSIRGRFRDAKNALGKANAIIDGSLPTQGSTALAYHVREDPELVASALQIAATELQNSQSILSELSAMEELALKEAQSFIAVSGGYVQSAQQYLSEVQTLSAESTKEYTWFDTRYREIKAEYDQTFGLIAPPQQQQGQGR